MGRLLSFLLSLAVAIIVTAAGALIDAQPLLYSGIFLVALVSVLWFYSLIKPVTVTIPTASAEPDWTPQDEKQRALLALKRARDNGRIALHDRSEDGAYRAIHEIQAALTSVKKRYGVGGPLKISGHGRYLDFLRAYVAYVDAFYPYLREGHIEQAKQFADRFEWET